MMEAAWAEELGEAVGRVVWALNRSATPSARAIAAMCLVRVFTVASLWPLLYNKKAVTAEVAPGSELAFKG
jgi:hypothetical protein